MLQNIIDSLIEQLTKLLPNLPSKLVKKIYESSINIIVCETVEEAEKSFSKTKQGSLKREYVYKIIHEKITKHNPDILTILNKDLLMQIIDDVVKTLILKGVLNKK